MKDKKRFYDWEVYKYIDKHPNSSIIKIAYGIKSKEKNKYLSTAKALIRLDNHGYIELTAKTIPLIRLMAKPKND